MNQKFILQSLFRVVLLYSKLYALHGQCVFEDSASHSIVMNCSDDSFCPTWNYCSSGSCLCGEKHHGIIQCSNNEKNKISAILDCNCVTYDEDTGLTFVGACFYNCENNVNDADNVYHTLPEKPKELLNSSVCSWFNRKGLLCGECEEGFSPFVLSYNLSCMQCPDGHKNWWKFVMVGFVPLTFFYFLIVVFKINVTSSGLHGVVWFSQTISIPALMRFLMVKFSKNHLHSLIAIRIFIPFYSFWNLDFFHSVIPDTCLNVSPLQALALEYVVALYPFVLIFLSYCMIVLYDAKVTPIIILWTPFRKFFALFRSTWDVRTSVIDSFASVYLLSHVKILSVSVDLLIPTKIYRLNSDAVMYGLYYLPSVPYFGKYHLPYATLALIVLTVFVIIPSIIFTLYPLQSFQKLMTYFSINWYSLRIYVDSFQGCYKDGTEPGTFDCRWFSALVLLARPLFFILYALTLSMMFFAYSVILLTMILILHINIQPYKKSSVRYPSTDSTFYILLSLFFLGALGLNISSTENHFSTITLTFTVLISALVPLFYITYFILSWLIKIKRQTE